MAERISHDAFLRRLAAQDVERHHYAFRCVHCGHVQPPESMRQRCGLDDDKIERAVFFACEGRFNPDYGCNWTLGGLLQIHTLEIEADDGTITPAFEPATPEEAQTLKAQISAPATQLAEGDG